MPTPDETWYEFTKKMNDPNFREEVQREAIRALKLEEERRRAVQPGFKGILGDTKAAEELFNAGVPGINREAELPNPEAVLDGRYFVFEERESDDHDTRDDDRQPMPTKEPENAPGDIWLQIINDMTKRREVGIRRYKTALRPFNSRNSLRDLFEELLDALVYTRQAIEEKRQTNEFLSNAAYTLLMAATQLEVTILHKAPTAYESVDKPHLERIKGIAENLKRIVRNQSIEEPKPTEK